MMKFKDEEKLIVVAAPSGAGKTSIVRGLLAKYDFLDFSISATTREKREHEVHGKDYYFFTKEEFLEKVENGEFLEYEEVYKGTYYGTLNSELERIWKADKHIIFDVDVQGAIHIKSKFPQDCLSIFIKAPSLFTLYERLKKRASETEKSLDKRIRKAEKEMTFQKAFDKVVVNDILEEAINDASHVVLDFINNQKLAEK